MLVIFCCVRVVKYRILFFSIVFFFSVLLVYCLIYHRIVKINTHAYDDGCLLDVEYDHCHELLNGFFKLRLF